MPAERFEPPPAVSARVKPFRALANPLAIAILCIVVFAVYLPGIGIPYFGDDLGWVDTSTNALKHFVQVNADGWYRPLQASIYTVVQKNFGLSTVPIHVLGFFIHALLCWLILKFMLELGYGWVSALLAASFMALSQANAFALLSNDTLSQVAGTFFGCLSLWAFAGTRLRRGARYAVSVAAFALALLSKETTAAFFPILVCASAFNNWPAAGKRSWLQNVAAESFPFAVVFAGYLLIRSAVGANSPSFGSGGYNFDLGVNVLLNLFLDLSALVVPTSTVRAFEAYYNGQTGLLAFLVCASLLVLFAVVYGLWLRRKDLRIAAAIVFLLGSTFPMVLMNHVSELYVYNAMPFFSALVGIGIGALLESPLRLRVKQIVAAAFAVMLASHVAADREKAALMHENGQRAARLVAGIGGYIRQVPPHGALLLVNPPVTGAEYAVYLMRGFNVLEFEEPYIKKMYAREDIDLRIVEAADLRSRPAPRGAVILGLEGDALRLLAPPGKNKDSDDAAKH